MSGFLAATGHSVVEMQPTHSRISELEDRIKYQVGLITGRLLIVRIIHSILNTCVRQIGYLLIDGSLSHFDATHHKEEILGLVLGLVFG